MIARTPHLRPLESTAVLLITATIISTLSFSFHLLAPTERPVMESIFAYLPLLFGGVAIGLCVRAINKASHKRLVMVYTVILAPFAFSHPAWMIILWILYTSGHYKGAMP
jgi:hypothetical protein